MVLGLASGAGGGCRGGGRNGRGFQIADDVTHGGGVAPFAAFDDVVDRAGCSSSEGNWLQKWMRVAVLW